MRKILAVGCALFMLAGPAAAQSPGLTYAYEQGVATVTQRNEDGDITATLTCRPPDGDIIITDYSFGRAGRRATSAAVRVGNLSVTIPATAERVNRKHVVTIRLPQRPPMLAGVQQSDVIAVTVNNQTHTYRAGSAMQLKDLAYACWGS